MSDETNLDLMNKVRLNRILIAVLAAVAVFLTARVEVSLSGYRAAQEAVRQDLRILAKQAIETSKDVEHLKKALERLENMGGAHEQSSRFRRAYELDRA
jgi:hypothetical protein